MRALCFIAALACGCGSIDAQWQLKSYDVQAEDAVKRIVVATWVPSAYEGVGPLLGQIATDFVRLRKNYLVYDPVVAKRDFGEACGEQQGVLMLRLLDMGIEEQEVTTHLQAGLFRCSDGRLLWSTETELDNDSNDEDLAQLAEVYMRQQGELATRFAAPLFAVVQTLLRELPDPKLTDAEIEEKILLGTEPPVYFDDLLAFVQ